MLYAGVAVIQMPAMIETEVVSARTDVHSLLLCAIDRFVMPAVFPLVTIFSNKPRIPAQSNHVSVRVTIGHTTHLIIVGARHNCEQQANSWKCAKKTDFSPILLNLTRNCDLYYRAIMLSDDLLVSI